MAHFEFRLPDIGEGVHEGEIMAWHVSPGDVVVEDQPMVEVMTDKATVTIDVPRAGVIAAVNVEEGTLAKVGEVIVVIDTEAVSAPSSGAVAASEGAGRPEGSAPHSQSRSEGPAASAVGDIKDGLPGASFFAARRPEPPSAPLVPPPSEYFQDKPLATPATRKLARDLEVDLRRVPPSGPGGRVTAADVRATAGGGVPPVAPAPSTARAVGAGASRAGFETLPGAPAPRPAEGPRELRTPFRGMRRRIADRLQKSARTAVHYTFVEELDATPLLTVRDRLAPFAAERGVSLSFLPFVVKAVVEALRRYPIMNSYLDDASSELVTRRYYDIGIATDTEAGLMVPAVRDADRRSLLHIAREIDRLASACRAGRVAPADLGGTTFTITSLGKQGGLFATPVLNHPEVGILGVHRIKKKPVVRDGEIVVGDQALLSFSFDHRVVDGALGARFAYAVIDILENPEALFLDMV